jgi:hypothetical protein
VSKLLRIVGPLAVASSFANCYKANEPPALPLSREAINTEKRVKRGEESLKGLFDEKQAPYKYEIKSDFKKDQRTSDLPLRSGSESSSHPREVRYNLGGESLAGSTPQINLATITTKKTTKRDTMAWKWEDNKVARLRESRALLGEANTMAAPSLPFMGARPPLTHSATAPVGDRPMSEAMLDIDALMGDEPTELVAPTFSFPVSSIAETPIPPSMPAFSFPAQPTSAASPNLLPVINGEDGLST